ncbi:MAG: PAS domain S-box protein [Deltaproteobacteria bacterium]|nr:PAS domain S-box protein [Deltaproteobacteria bacterium]
MKRSFGISAKIWLSLGILVLGYFGSMMLGFFLGRQAELRLHIISECLFPAAKQSQFALVAFKEEIKFFDDVVVLGEESFISSAKEKGRLAHDFLMNIMAIDGLSDLKKERIEKTVQKLNEFNRIAIIVYSDLSEYLDVMQADEVKDDKKSLRQKAFLLAEQTKVIKKELTSYAREFSDELKGELAQIMENTRRQRYINLVVFFLVVIVALGLISIIISRSISRPLQKTFMLESAVEQSIDGIAVSELNGNIGFANQAWAEMHGYGPEEISGMNMDSFHTDEQLRNELTTFKKFIVAKGAHTGSVGHKKKDGTTFISMMTSTVLKRNGNSDLSIVNIARDITENKRQEKELRMAKEKTEETNIALQKSLEILKQTQDHLVESEKMVSLGGLVAGVAHEINTPLGVGLTASSFLADKAKEYEKLFLSGALKRSDLEKLIKITKESSTILLTNLDRAAELVRSFKQVAVDQSEVEHRTFNLKQYMDDLLVSLRPNFRQNRHSVNVQCPDDLEVDSYPGVFSQVVTNLLMNSLQHGFDNIDDGEISIDINTNKNSGELCIDYRDNGKGMSKEAERKVFEPFFTTRRGQGGTGLGMHIVYNLVTQALGGKIVCKSSLGKGTLFSINVPLK